MLALFKKTLNTYLSKSTLVLIFISYLFLFLKNNVNNYHVLLSASTGALFVGVCVLQLLLNLLLLRKDSRVLHWIYLLLIFLIFIFLNCAYPIITLIRESNIFTNGFVRGRYLLPFITLIVFYVTFKVANNFFNTIRAINVFVLTFIFSSILFIVTEVGSMKNNNVVFDDFEIRDSKSQSEVSSKENILIIILDEYSSKEEMKPFIKDSIQLNLLSNNLDSIGFEIVDKQTTKDTLTFNSISGMLNYDRSSYLKDKSEQTALMNLKRASVISKFERSGYVFKNFSFLNISNHKEFYYWYPYPRNQIEFLFKNSMLPHVVPFFNINYINTFEQFAISSDYNKKVYKESLDYINGLNGKSGYITYVHFLLPHSPYYIKDEFPHAPTTFNSYIEYWKYTNGVIIEYINSINKLKNYKVIVTGDHGYRTNKMVNPYNTMSAFYNFRSSDVNEVKSVQDIGKILLITLK